MSTSADLPWRRAALSDDQVFNINNNLRRLPKRKRIHLDEPLAPVKLMVTKRYHTPSHQIHQSSFPLSVAGPKSKKSKTPRICGLSLPVSRLIETLNKDSLQDLLQQIITHHPETAATISKVSSKANLDDSVTLIRSKFQKITDHLPYKCDVESDYSYIRVKVHLTEFLNCSSDFILTLLPPMDVGLSYACSMLDVITTMIHNLPNFSNNEFQYTKSTAYEQIANLWLIILTNKANREDDGDAVCDDSTASTQNVENTLEFVRTIRTEDILAKLEKHNELSLGKFTAVLDFIKSELEAYERIHHSLNNNGISLLSDMISVDYSNYSITARTSH